MVKPNAKKIRRLPQGVILGFAGATADCFTLLEKLEGKLEEHPGKRIRGIDSCKDARRDTGRRLVVTGAADLIYRCAAAEGQLRSSVDCARIQCAVSLCTGQLVRSCVELAKQWRTDRYLRHLEASWPLAHTISLGLQLNE